MKDPFIHYQYNAYVTCVCDDGTTGEIYTRIIRSEPHRQTLNLGSGQKYQLARCLNSIGSRICVYLNKKKREIESILRRPSDTAVMTDQSHEYS